MKNPLHSIDRPPDCIILSSRLLIGRLSSESYSFKAEGLSFCSLLYAHPVCVNALSGERWTFVDRSSVLVLMDTRTIRVLLDLKHFSWYAVWRVQLDRLPVSVHMNAWTEGIWNKTWLR